MNIIGAGLTGCLAAYAFKNAVVHEYLKEPRVHKAVLRFRSEEVSKLTGIPFKRIIVHKGVFSNGIFVRPSLKHMNHYSRKVAGGYYDRSIANLEPSVRWIAPVDFHQQMLDHLVNRVFYGSDMDLVDMATPVISTLPLPVLISKFGLDAQLPPKTLDARPIYVTTMTIDKCESYQTIYYPDPNQPVYRASITGNKLIIESTNVINWLMAQKVIESFGINKLMVSWNDEDWNNEQPNGKFVPMEDEKRKQLMYDITVSLGIYSLGRHATWRKILLDDVVQDIARIESMMKTSAYDRMLGKTK